MGHGSAGRVMISEESSKNPSHYPLNAEDFHRTLVLSANHTLEAKPGTAANAGATLSHIF